MKILFVSCSSLVFNEQTPLHEPLGGTESAICYLSAALRQRGHETTICNRCMPTDQAFDFIILTNGPVFVPSVDCIFSSSKLILWNHMLPNQPSMSKLGAAKDRIDAFVYVSEKQREMFYELPWWNLPDGHVIGNAIAPCFENMYGSVDQILDEKECRGAYTSTPFRGLEHLADLREIPIDVYSSMRVYQGNDDPFAVTFDRLLHNPAIKMHG